MCQLGLLIRERFGFVIKCVSVPRDSMYHQEIIIDDFIW